MIANLKRYAMRRINLNPMAQQTAVEWLYNKLSTCTSDEMVGNINNWFEEAKKMEQEQLKEMYLNGIQNYDPTFKRKSQWTKIDNKQQ